MKNKDIKRHFRRKIQSGWREYLTISIPLKALGYSESDLPNLKRVCKLMECLPTERGNWVGTYYLKDPLKSTEDAFLGVTLEIAEFTGKTLEEAVTYASRYLEAEENTIKERMKYVHTPFGFKIFLAIGTEGMVSNSWKESDLSYWIDENSVQRCLYDIPELLGMFVNDAQLQQNFRTTRDNSLLGQLGRLGRYTKSDFFEYNGEHLHLTYAIRYPENVEPFLRDLVKLVKEFKHIKIK